jgi:hypothetical protein
LSLALTGLQGSIMFLIAGIGMTLPISTIGLGLAAVYYVWLVLTGFPTWWGVAGTIYCLWYMGGAYRMIAFFNGQGGVQTNGAAAACLPFAVHLLVAIYFATSHWPSQLSPLWALLIPLTFVLQLLLQGGLELLLDLVYPAGRRQ